MLQSVSDTIPPADYNVAIQLYGYALVVAPSRAQKQFSRDNFRDFRRPLRLHARYTKSLRSFRSRSMNSRSMRFSRCFFMSVGLGMNRALSCFVTSCTTPL